MDANVAPNLQRSSPPTKLKFVCVLFTACFCWWLVCNQFTELVNPPQQMDVASPKRSKPATARRRASSDIVREGDSLPSGKTPLNPLSGSVWLAPRRRGSLGARCIHFPFPASTSHHLHFDRSLAAMTAEFLQGQSYNIWGETGGAERKRNHRWWWWRRMGGDTDRDAGWKTERTVTSKIGRVKLRMNGDKRRWNRGVNGWEGTQPPKNDSKVCAALCQIIARDWEKIDGIIAAFDDSGG